MNATIIIKKSRHARRLRITVVSNSMVRVTVPRFVSLRAARIFVAEKSSWIKQKLAEMSRHPPVPPLKGSVEEYVRYRLRASELARDKVNQLNAFYNFRYKKITIRNMASRWGSCSRQGALNFHYKIFLLPPRLQDYLVAHELCHLREMNHSRQFWNLVAQTIPDYKIRRKELKRPGK